MNLLYNIGIGLYKTGTKVFALGNEKVRKMLEIQRQAFTKINEAFKGEPVDLWVHVVSLGEYEKALPLIKIFRREHPQAKIAVSFCSPLAYEVGSSLTHLADCVFILPFDTRDNAKKIINVLCPGTTIFVKNYFCGNYLQQLYEHNMDVYLISAVFHQQHPLYNSIESIEAEMASTSSVQTNVLSKHMLDYYTHIYVQDTESTHILKKLGVTDATVTGNTRVDWAMEVKENPQEIANIEQFSSKEYPTIVFGSTWSSDEEMFVHWLNRHPQVKAIIALQEYEATDRIDNLLQQLAPRGKVMLLSQWESEPDPRCNTILVDSIGKLSTLYRYGDIAYVGGGFSSGVQNVIEPAVYGIPVIFGPKYRNSNEAIDLIHCGGAFTASDREHLENILNKLTAQAERGVRGTEEDIRHRSGMAAGNYIHSKAGASERIYNDIFRKSKNRMSSNAAATPKDQALDYQND